MHKGRPHYGITKLKKQGTNNKQDRICVDGVAFSAAKSVSKAYYSLTLINLLCHFDFGVVPK